MSARLKCASRLDGGGEDAGVEPGFLSQDVVEARVGGGLARNDRAVLADLGREIVGSDDPGLGDDLVLVVSDQRPQDGQRRALGDDRKILEGLGGDLADGFAGDDRAGVPALGDGLGRPQHQSLEDDLPVARGDLRLDLPTDGVEVDGMEARPSPALPEVGQAFGDRERLELMGPATEVAEDIVEGDAAAQQSPGGDGGVEATREQADGTAFGAERQAARAACLATKK